MTDTTTDNQRVSESYISWDQHLDEEEGGSGPTLTTTTNADASLVDKSGYSHVPGEFSSNLNDGYDGREGNVGVDGDGDGDEETVPKEIKSRIRLINFVGLIVNADFSISIPVLYLFLLEFGSDTRMLGYTLGVFALARFFVSPLLGKWADSRGEKEALIVGLLVCAGGNLIYAFAWDIWAIFIGRMVSGCGAAIHGVALGYISKVTPVSKRGDYISSYWLVALLGMILAPGFGAIFTTINYGYFNAYRLPGFFIAAVCVLMVLWVLISMKNGVTESVVKQANIVQVSLPIPSSARGILFQQFVFGFMLAVYQCIVTPMSRSQLGWTAVGNTVFFLCIGVLVLITVVAAAILEEKFSPKSLMVFATLFTLIGLLVGIDWGDVAVLATFIVSGVFFVIGYSMSVGLLPTIYSEEIDHMPRKGHLMGILSSAQAIANFAGPPYAANVLHYAGENTTIIGMIAMGVFALVVQWIFYADVGKKSKSDGLLEETKGERLLSMDGTADLQLHLQEEVNGNGNSV